MQKPEPEDCVGPAEAADADAGGKGWNAVAAFQCFVAGGITSAASLINLFLMGETPDWQTELLGLIVVIVLGIGLTMMAGGYLLLLTSRLTTFFSRK